MYICHFFILLIALAATPQVQTFKQDQLKFSRVANAYAEKERSLKDLFASKNLRFEGFQLFIRAFKKERTLEVWIKEKNASRYQLLLSYPFCASSGALGPKRREGDGQIPEGIYSINHFNPFSNFHLSLGINYPNASDRKLSDPQHPGGSIYIHGNCVTIGCIPITDERIKELYILGVEARTNGQQKIPVHIFPAQLEPGVVEQLQQELSMGTNTIVLWKSMEIVYEDFESTGVLRPVKVNDRGWYYL